MSDDINNRLIYAVRNGELDTVKELIDSFGLDYCQTWSHGYVLLRDAVANEHTEITKLLLTEGSNVNSSNKRLTSTPLHFAAENDNLEIAEMLLDRDADIEAINEWGDTPLRNAIKHGNVEMIKLLIKRGANVNAPLESPHLEYRNYYITRDGYTPLHVATSNGSDEIIKLLLSSDADVDSKGTNGKTPLHIAAEEGYLQIVEILLTHGACVNCSCSETGREGYTPMHFATEKRHPEIVQLLLNSHADVDSKGTTDLTPLYIATKHGHDEIVNLLLKHGANVDAQDKYGTTVLQCAVKNGSYKIVTHILKFCPDVNNKSNKSSINIAVQSYGQQFKTIVENLLQYGFTVNPEDVNDCKLLHAAVQKGYLKLVEDLLKSGADVNMLSSNNDTPLHSATKYEQEQIVTLLINFGANVNADDKTGKPPIFFAIENRDLNITKLLLTNGANVKDRPDLLKAAVKKNFREIVEILLQHNADINATGENGLTALHFTVLYQDDFVPRFKNYTKKYFDNDAEEIFKLLLSSGANVNAQTKKSNSANFRGYASIFHILEYNDDVISVTGDITPLHIATQKKNVIISKLLLNKGANVNAKQQDGATSLHIATEIGNKQVVEVLLQSGAEVDSKTQEGTTPLHIAAQQGYVDIVEILLKFGADIESRDEHGETALHVASEENNIEIVEVLLDCGSDINIMNRKSNSTPLNLVMDRAISHWEIDFFDITNILKNHVVKLQTANLYVCDKNLLSINTTDYFKNECEEEVKKMKSEKIIMNNNVSFHDILTKNINLVAAYARNESLVQVLISNDYKTKFPLYASMINCHFKNGVERKELLEQGFNIIPGLPYNCTEKIFYYLSNKDIRMVIDAYKPSNVSSPSTETSC